jgi:hypothetical protein
LRTVRVIRSHLHTALVAACVGILFSMVSAQPQEQPSALQPHVRAIERAIAARSLPIIRAYLNPKKTYIDILGKPATYLSVNQAVAVIESFFRQNIPVGYAMGVIKEGAPTGVAISSLRVKSISGERVLKVTMGFSKDYKAHWLINRIIIR